MHLKINEVIQSVNGTCKINGNNDVVVTGVEFDARKIKNGDLFIPMKGARDGQEFINQAIANGAVAVCYEDDKYLNDSVVMIKVDDTKKALQILAKYYLKTVNPKVLAITGSNGKTTTKDMTYAVVNTKYNAYKTDGNYNNDIGMPYTILQMPSTTEVLVLEMGMDGFRQISELSKIAMPDMAAITLIGESHMEHLGSREGIAKAKMEIIDGMSEQGLLFLPQDDLLLRYEIPQTIRTFSIEQSADVVATDIVVAQNETVFHTNLNNDLWKIPVIGDYNVSNALIAISFGLALDIELEQIANGLEHFQLTNSRTEWLKRSNGADILSDVYNANPTAMKKVVQNFSQINTNKQKIAVLGDMLELGEASAEMHSSVAEFLNPSEIDYVVLYGDIMENLSLALRDKYDLEHLLYYPSDKRLEMLNNLDDLLQEDTMTVFKASNGMKLAQIVEQLVK